MKKEFDVLAGLIDRAMNSDYSKIARKESLFSAYNFKQAVRNKEYNAYYMSRALEYDRTDTVKSYLDNSKLLHCLIVSSNEEHVSINQTTYINITVKEIKEIDELLGLYDNGASHTLIISQDEKTVLEILALPTDEAVTQLGHHLDSGLLMHVHEYDFQETIAPLANIPKGI